MRRRLGFLVVLVVLIITLPGCSLLGSDDPVLRLETNKETYDLSYEDVVTVTATNQSSSRIYYSTCMPTVLQELDGSRVVASTDLPLCECLCPAELAPGREWRYSVSVAGIGKGTEGYERRDGTSYRLRLAFYKDRRMKTLLAEDMLSSNRFELTR